MNLMNLILCRDLMISRLMSKYLTGENTFPRHFLYVSTDVILGAIHTVPTLS